MLRIGIFGGTFSPPHNGHMYIAREAMKSARLDKMIFVPCGNPYHKTSRVTVEAYHRFEMVRLAIEDEPGFEICDIEMRSNEPSYTAETLERLKRLFPNDRLCLLVGGDSLIDMEGWYAPKKIFEMAEVIAAKRGGIDSAEVDAAADRYRKKYKAVVTVIDIKPFEMSASDIRKRLAAGAETEASVSKKVLDYIKKTKIYEGSI